MSPAVQAASLTIGGSGTDLATFRRIANAFTERQPDVQINILPSIGSGGAIHALNKGAIDLGLLSRPLKKREASNTVRARPYGLTPLVFAVHQDLPVEAVSTEEIAAIYAGEHRRWADGRVVRPILRPRGDSDVLVLERFLPSMREALAQAYDRRGVPIATSDQDSASLIATVPGGIGTSTLALILAEERPLKPLALNGVVPSAQALADGRYPLAKSLYLVFRTGPDPALQAFVDFVFSNEGAAILRETGHVVLSPEADRP